MFWMHHCEVSASNPCLCAQTSSLSVELCSTGMRVCIAQLPTYDFFERKHVNFLDCLSDHSI